MSVKLLTKHYLEFLNLKGGCTCSSESTLAKIPQCWKSHVPVKLISSCRLSVREITMFCKTDKYVCKFVIFMLFISIKTRLILTKGGQAITSKGMLNV